MADAMQQQLAQLQATITAMQGQLTTAQADAATARAEALAAQNAATAAQAAANNAGGNVAGQQNQPNNPNPVVFARSPAGANAGPVDYNSTNGFKLWKAATSSLRVTFDLRQENLRLFLGCLHERAMEQGWLNNVLTFTIDGNRYNILTSYGQVTEDVVSAQGLALAFQDSRENQNSCNLYACIRASLTDTASLEVMAESAKYIISGAQAIVANPALANTVQPADSHYDGGMLLKFVIDKAAARTHASIGVIVANINNLTEKMSELDSDVRAFNTYVAEQLSAYLANKGSAFDEEVLFQNIMSAYLAVKDKEFHSWANHKNTLHEEGDAILASSELLQKGFNIFNNRSIKGEWRAASAEQKEIINLNASIDLLKEQVRSQVQLNAEHARQPKSKPPLDVAAAEKRRKERYDSSPGWMKQRPTDGKGTKVHESERYFWCPAHKLWQRHKPEDCRLKKQLAKARSSQQQPAAAATATSSSGSTAPSTASGSSSKSPPAPAPAVPELVLEESLAVVAEEQELDYDFD